MGAADELIGTSEEIRALRAQTARLLTRQKASGGRFLPILLLGETGVGKGLLVRSLHRESTRRERPLVEINCAAIPDTLVEAELFGYERGAFTDARQPKPGLFQAAHGGVLFLDEIGMLPLNAQAKLLTALDRRQVRRLGGTRAEATDVWVISATNEDLSEAMAKGRFRTDLYHRISSVVLRVPPLRERGQDILALAAHFLAQACADYGLPPRELSAEAERLLLAHAWPGNVRELANLMERAALLSDEPEIAPDLLELSPPSAQRRDAREPSARQPERDAVQEALEATNWNLSKAAARLGVPRNTLRYRIERLGLRRHGAPPPSGAPDATPVAASATPDSAVGQLRWERRWIAALRVTLNGPADAGDFHVAPALEAVLDKARSFGATLDDLHPAGFTAFYGLAPMEDAPHRAGLTAQAIHRALARSARRGVAARAALHVAECLIARGTAVPGMDTADRRRVSEALEAVLRAGEPGTTAVSAEAARFLRRAFELESLEGVEGRSGAYRIADDVRSELAVRGRPRSPFVGRDRELSLLDDLLAQAEGGRGQLVGIAGEPGVGKSRLVHEFRESLGRDRVTHVEGHCAAYGGSTPYLPLIALARDAFRFGEADEPDAIAERVASEVHRVGLPADAVVPYVLHMLGIKRDPGADLPSLSPEAMRIRTMEAVRHVLVAAAQQRPMMVVIEDLHWIDPTSEEIISALAESIAASRILLIATYRPGYQPSWLGKSYATSAVLRRLPRAESQAIVAAAGRAAPPLPPHVVDEIVARGDGNPFFLEELARAVSEADPGQPGTPIPDTLQGVLTARLDRLPATDRELLQTAAVLGKEGAVTLLREIAGLADLEFVPTLARLRAAEFLYETAVVPAPHYAFQHVLTQEVAYHSLADRRRRELHASVARAVERSMPTIAERSPEVLARHYGEAGLLTEAIGYWRRAGQLASRQCAHAEAIEHLTRGLALIEELPPGPSRVQVELALRLGLVASLIATRGEASLDVDATLERARALVRELDDSPQLFAVHFGLWRLSLARAQVPASAETARHLLQIAEASGDPGLLMAANLATGNSAYFMGELARARVHLERSLAVHRPEFEPTQILVYGQSLEAGALGYLASNLGIMGYLDQAAAVVDRGLAVARRSGHPFTLAFALMLCGHVRQLRREPRVVMPLGEELAALAQEQGYGWFVAVASGLIGSARAAEDPAGPGLAQMQEAARTFLTFHRIGLAYRTHLAEALLRGGHLDEALDVVDGTLAHTNETRELSHVADLHRLRGEIFARMDRQAEARGALLLAFDVATAQGACTFALRAGMALAALAAETEGHVPPADRERLAATYAEFTEGFHLDDLRRARRLLGRD